MMRVDLHCHSCYSEHPSEWFLQRIGARECYTDVETLYRQAKARGMTHVTITDHNAIDGALELVRAHPDDTFVSVETTAYFPEDGCKIHVLIYDISRTQFQRIQKLRTDIYRLCRYLRSEGLACSVAHATYSVNGRLSRDVLEKLILLFDVFEGINGTRGDLHNRTLRDILGALGPRDIERLSRKHGIEPSGKQPWTKGLTAGSDDHAGLFIGATYTSAFDCNGVGEFFERVRNKDAEVGGSPGGHKTLAFAIYKITYDFSRERATTGNNGPMGLLSSFLFDSDRNGLRQWWTLKRLKKAKDSRARALARFFEDVAACKGPTPDDMQARMHSVYDGLGRLSDEFFVMVARSLEDDLKSGHTDKIFQNLSALLPAAFMITPFFSTMHHLYSRNRDMLREFCASIGDTPPRPSSRVLWFSDTVADLNGVAVTMRELATTALRTGRPMKLVTCLTDKEADALPPNTINLPCIYAVTPEFYSAYTLRLPSILAALDLIAREAPDRIVISTPGPVGLLALAAARVLGVPCTGVYHTDFTKQADMFIGDAWISSVIESGTRWFFRQMDEVRVPSEQYIAMLADRGLEPDRMKIFRRGIDPEFAVSDERRQQDLRHRFDLPERGTTLMWAGRLGKEKNLDFLMDVCREVMTQRPNTTLLIAGDGPERERLASRNEDPRVIFTGRVDRSDLAQLYQMSDVFVFPSTTDTFGMVVLEGHACGLPAIVTDVGGPQEIVRNGETGFIVKADDRDAWVKTTLGMIDLKEKDTDIFDEMRAKARQCSQTRNGWGKLLDEMGAVGGATDDAPPAHTESDQRRGRAVLNA